MAENTRKQRSLEKYNKSIRRLLPRRCILTAGKCSLASDKSDKLISKQPYAFVMRPYAPDCSDMERACRRVIRTDCFVARNADSGKRTAGPTRSDMAAIMAKDEKQIGSGYCQICSMSLYAFYGIAELGHLNPNVLLEAGLMFALAKPVVFTLDTRLTSLDDVPFDLNGLLLLPYSSYSELESGLRGIVRSVHAELKVQGIV